MNAAANNGTDDFKNERSRLFAEIAALKQQRDGLQRQLAECRRENSRLRAQLGGGE